MKKNLIIFIVLCTYLHVAGQDSLPLYPAGVPGSRRSSLTEKQERDQNGVLRISDVSQPSITVFHPDKNINAGTAVIICPGGGYARLSASHEGSDVAKTLTQWGITAVVLKYRLPNDAIMEN